MSAQQRHRIVGAAGDRRFRLNGLSSQLDRSALPTIGQMIRDQTGLDVAPETQAEMVKRFSADL